MEPSAIGPTARVEQDLVDGGEEPTGARCHLFGFGIEEDLGSVAFSYQRALLEDLSGAELENHGVGAVANGGDAGGAAEDVVEEARSLVTDGRLGDHVPCAGDVPLSRFSMPTRSARARQQAIRISSKNSR